MSKIGSKVVWIAGGSAMFVATYIAVAVARGAALREVPPLSWMSAPGAPGSTAGAASGEHAPGASTVLPQGSEQKGGASNASATGAAQAHGQASDHASAASAESHAPPRSTPAVPPMTAGVLGAFVMPSPYDARELHDLEKSLKDRLTRVAAEEERQKKRERELDDWQNVLQQRAQELAALRKSMDEPGATGEKNASDKATSKSITSWRALAPLFEEGDPSDVAERLSQLEPDQAAQVLRGLDSERCAAILNALPKDRYKTFLDAWRRAGG